MIKEYIGCKSTEGDNFNMWLTDTEIIRCKDCKKFETVDCAVYRALRTDGRIDEKGMFNPDGFCAWGQERE